MLNRDQLTQVHLETHGENAWIRASMPFLRSRCNALGVPAPEPPALLNAIYTQEKWKTSCASVGKGTRAVSAFTLHRLGGCLSGLQKLEAQSIRHQRH